MAGSKFKLSAIPSPKDERDYKVAMLAPTLNTFPESFRIPYNGKIKNQGDVGSCVAYSLSYIREIQEEKQTGEFKEFSVGFVYANRQPEDHQEPGMIPRQALNSLRKTGNVYHELFPFNEEYPNILKRFKPVAEGLSTTAEPYRVTTYAKIDTLDQLKSALMQLGPVTACFPIHESFYKLNEKNAKAKIPNKKKKADKFLGYHEMTIVGWTEDDSLIVLNSWGDNWGDGGYAYIPQGYPITEMWSVTDNILPDSTVSKGEKGKFFSILVDGIFQIKTTAYTFLKSLQKKGIENAYVMQEDGHYEVRIGYYHSEDDPNLDKVKCKLDECGIPNRLVQK